MCRAPEIYNCGKIVIVCFVVMDGPITHKDNNNDELPSLFDKTALPRKQIPMLAPTILLTIIRNMACISGW
jgi:hypothetical protein